MDKWFGGELIMSRLQITAKLFFSFLFSSAADQVRSGSFYSEITSRCCLDGENF
jgi:hypothetical protein